MQTRFSSSTFVLLVLLLPAAFAGAGVADPPARPNVVLIMADDLGYEGVGVNGGLSYRTPHLDRLAAGGMRFTQAYAQPLCTPSRVQIMTGLYNDRNYTRFGRLEPKAWTFGHLFRDAGYATCIVGKWQLDGGLDAPARFGFDRHCLWQLNRRPNRYPNPGLEIDGRQVDFRTGEYGPDLVSDYLLDFIETNRDRPFFAWYPMILPHWPFEPTPDSPDWDPAARRDDRKEIHRNLRSPRHFADMVAYTDKVVGRIIEKLEKLGLRENTVVLFTTDNGTFKEITSNTVRGKVTGGKGQTDASGTHVPLFASFPGTIPPGSVNENLVDFSDFLPTLAELAGLQLPEGRSFDGRSFAKQLHGDPAPHRQEVFCWYRHGGKTSRHVHDGRHKLYDDGRFYDLKADPFEKGEPLDVAGLDPDAQETRNRFEQFLAERLKLAGR